MTAQSQSTRTLFEQAQELQSPSERQAFLDQQCGRDRELRAEVEALLAAYSSAGDFLEAPAADLQGIWGELPATHASTTETQSSGGNAARSRLDFLEPPREAEHLGRLAHYEIWEVIGSGSMGVVLKAFDEKLQRLVAIKALAPAWAASDEARKRFVREARSAAAVCHDHLVPIYAVEDSGSVPYFVMQYIAGGSLQERIDREGPLPIDEVLRLGVQIAEGLAAAHRQGLVHRDIKPGNILLETAAVSQGPGVRSQESAEEHAGPREPTTRVRIADFGLARAVDDASLSHAGLIAGTPEYMSPEQARGHAVDHRADLFSLGSVLYAMCTGQLPFRADGSLPVLRRICDDTPQQVSALRPDVPQSLTQLIDRLHAKEPADRPQSADEVKSLLLACRNVRSRPGHVVSRLRRRDVAIALGTALAGSLVAFSWLGSRRTNKAPISPSERNAGAKSAVPPNPTRLHLPRVLIIIPSRDFAYSESNTVRTQLANFGVACDIASTTLDDCQPFPQSSAAPAQPVKPDLLLANAKAADYAAIYFCGGPGAEDYFKKGTSSSQARRLIDEALAADRTVAATGIGVVVLAEAEAIRGREVACYPYGQPPLVYARRIEAGGALCSTQAVVEDGPFLTNRGPQDMAPFTRALLNRLGIEPRPPPSPAPKD